MSTASTFRWDYGAVSGVQNRFRQGLVKMGYEVANKARDLAPYKTGALKNSVRVETQGLNDVYVVAGGKVGGYNVPYARIHELGGYAGRNHSVHIVAKHYLKNALENTVRGDFSRFFKGVA